MHAHTITDPSFNPPIHVPLLGESEHGEITYNRDILGGEKVEEDDVGVEGLDVICYTIILFLNSEGKE